MNNQNPLIMNSLEFCCEKFKCHWQFNSQSYPNIRVVKYTSDFLINSPHMEGKFKNPLRFYITFGYEIFKIDMVAVFIEYCPFCGKDLYKFYKSDKYANEIEGETFPMIK